MKINGIEMVVGDKYLVDGIEMVLTVFGDGRTVEVGTDNEHKENPYVRMQNGEDTWDMWYGKTEYYIKEGWHGVDGDEDEDGNGATVEKVEEV